MLATTSLPSRLLVGLVCSGCCLAAQGSAPQYERAFALRDQLRGTVRNLTLPGRWSEDSAHYTYWVEDDDGVRHGRRVHAATGVVEAVDDPPPADEPRRGGRRRRRPPTEASPDGVQLDGAVLTLRAEDGSEQQFTAGDGEARWRGVRMAPDGAAALAFVEHPVQPRRIHFVEALPDGDVQPRLHTLDYPKPGDPRARRDPVLLSRVDGSWQRRDLDPSLVADAWSVGAVHWAEDSRAVYLVYDQRGHQVQRLLAADVASGELRVVVEERSDTFIDYAHKTFVHHLEASDQVIWMSERSGYNHLYLIDRGSGAVLHPITSGEMVVRAVEHVDESAGTVDLRVCGLHRGQDPYYEHLLRARIDGGGSVALTDANGTHTATFAPDRAHVVVTWSRLDQPPVHELRRCRDGTRVVELTRADASRWLQRVGRAPQPLTAPGRDGSTAIWGAIWRPSDFDAARRYPVIEAIYAGPHGQHVPKSFAVYDAAQALAELGFVVVRIDGMGTNWRSKAFHDVAWKNLADSGFPDRIAWLRAAAAAHPELDLERVGIFGGSAGGQSALRAVLDHADFYRAAAADCGCHDNRVDKMWWNELWMGSDVDDEAYARSSNVVDAHKLGGALLLTVGELDRNVDPASTMQVVERLIAADKDFELIVFPGAGHGAGGSRYGVRRMYDFFVRELYGIEPRWTGAEAPSTPRRQRNPRPR